MAAGGTPVGGGTTSRRQRARTHTDSELGVKCALTDGLVSPSVHTAEQLSGGK